MKISFSILKTITNAQIWRKIRNNVLKIKIIVNICTYIEAKSKVFESTIKTDGIGDSEIIISYPIAF
jgi:hypothetical protein